MNQKINMKYNADFSVSKSDDWSTPLELYNYFIDHGYIDPCPLNSTIDGLEIQYFNKYLFVNPPFSKLSIWVDWCIQQYLNGCSVIILMPSRTDTKYFHKLLSYSPSLYFFEGRLKFGGSNKCAPFPTLLVKLEDSFIKIHCYKYGSLEKYIHKDEKKS